jgi:hypothetical protein
MPTFIIALVIALISFYIFANSADEIAYLCASISTVGLIVSLILTPWQLKLAILLLAFIASNRFLSPRNSVVNLQTGKPMVLNSTVKKLASDSKPKPANKPNFDLIYRGVPFKR